MGQKDGEKWTAAVDLQPTIPKSDRLLGRARLRALGYLDSRLHALVFTEAATGIRVISFRKANKREVLMYAQETKP